MRLDILIKWYVSEVMIQVSVTGLICSNIRDHISEACIFRHIVVFDSLLGSLHVEPVTKVGVAIIQLFQHYGVGVDSLLLEVSHKPMTRGRRDQVHQEVRVEEYSLRNGNR